MRYLVAALLLASAFTIVWPAAAQTEEKAVPILKAPYHLPIFTNDYVTVLKIWIPPGRNTGYHIHSDDSVSVNLVPADNTNQDFGSTEVARTERATRGNVTYAAYSKTGLRTHKASNIGQTPFHQVSFIFKKPAGQFTPGSRANVAGYSQVIDNERVRGWRLALDPGQSVPAITQGAPGLRIVLDGGEMAELVPGAADRGGMLATGEVFWQDAGTTRALKNIGTTRIDILEFELK